MQENPTSQHPITLVYLCCHSGNIKKILFFDVLKKTRKIYVATMATYLSSLPVTISDRIRFVHFTTYSCIDE